MDTRQYDLNELRSAYNNADSFQKKLIERAGAKIRKETRAIKEMREALVREHRNGNTQNIKDIHEFIKNKRKYSNE